MANCDNTVLLQKVKKHNPDRKFKVFFRLKLGDLQKKKKKRKEGLRQKKVFRPKTKIQRFFSAQKLVISKKKRSSPKFRMPKSKIQTFFPPKIRLLKIV